MSNLWPKEMPRHTDSEAEKKVFEALKTGLAERLAGVALPETPEPQYRAI